MKTNEVLQTKPTNVTESNKIERFEHTCQRKLIYVFSMPYDDHKGLLKVGEATISTDIKPELLIPNCKELNLAAKKRIEEYTKTASMRYTLEYTEIALRYNSDEHPETFNDKTVHNVLMNSGVYKVRPNSETGDEWFKTDIQTVKSAIICVKNWKKSIPSSMIVKNDEFTPIEFREEQRDAIAKTIRTFKKNNEMLWYAKMRFGKTLTALEVIRQSQYRRVIICTHRPVVDSGWHEDFSKVFYKDHSEHEYLYEKKTNDSYNSVEEISDYENDKKLEKLDKNGSHFIYFASIQDLRGSKKVGGNFNKNNAVFELNWDLIVIDEAHEGTQTELGDTVIKKLKKENTKVLALSGTPFNLLDRYDEENVYTWDYVMEQKKKIEWDIQHHGDHNPYADLPKMHIFTYDLGEKLKNYLTDSYETKAFNFAEFFRTWYKGPNSNRELPINAIEGNFVHEKDIIAFLNMLVDDRKASGYPFSTQEYRDMFKHTLWMVPGVKEAAALSRLLHQHPVFGKFGIANVAGEGDRYEEEHLSDALELVRKTIKDNEYSITLSCGKLTTGVTVKEWTAVLMLTGSYSTAAAQYMQTIFRVQSAGCIDGKQKTDCYVFDFAPDRTLKVLTETVHLSRKPGRSQKLRREALAEFLNFCPVISISDSKTRKYSVESMMEQIKQIYAERAVNSGFDDESIYNDELFKLNEIDSEKFNDLKRIIGASKATKKISDVPVNNQGLTDEQIAQMGEDSPSYKPDYKLTPEDKAEEEKKKAAREKRKTAISILRGISIRMPLLIYGANVSIDEDIDIEKFVELVDDQSWKEFMPNGVTKDKFNEFTKYYDRDVFIAAGKRIRRQVAKADRETPTKRVKLIAEIFSHFKNPDKETVLTPWRVVNIHMSDTIGGWCFFNDKFDDDKRLEEPRFVDQGDITKKVFRPKARILEINSKTGLYPLYIAYSFYKQKLNGMCDEDLTPEECQLLWNESLQNNLFVICKTPMAKNITKRTLCGYSNVLYNAHYYDDLVNMLRNKPEQFKKKVLKGSYWKKDEEEMKFDAIVGNPPYQEMDGGGVGSSAIPIYHYFVNQAKTLNAQYISLIIPSRWIMGGRGLDLFRQEMLNDKRIRIFHDYIDATYCFPQVEIKGGICYFLWDKDYSSLCHITTHNENNKQSFSIRPLLEENMTTYIRQAEDIFILNKIKERQEESFSLLVSTNDPFGYDIRDSEGTGYRRIKPQYTSESFDGSVKFYYNGWRKAGIGFIDKQTVRKNIDWIAKYKVLIPKAWGTGNKASDWLNPFIVDPDSVCTETYLVVGPFSEKAEAQNVVKYIRTKFFHYMLSLLKITQNTMKNNYNLIPIQDFSNNSDIDWNKKPTEINRQLFDKYQLSEAQIDYIEHSIATTKHEET